MYKNEENDGIKNQCKITKRTEECLIDFYKDLLVTCIYK